MLKQLAHLVAKELYTSDDPGIRLVPIVVFVQRIVRYLRDTATQMKKLVKKRSLFTWYIRQAHSKKEANMLLQAYEQCALVIMMDGVDEAAGERAAVEEFVHFELIPSGNRVVVTSRPSGVDRELYDRCATPHMPILQAQPSSVPCPNSSASGAMVTMTAPMVWAPTPTVAAPLAGDSTAPPAAAPQLTRVRQT